MCFFRNMQGMLMFSHRKSDIAAMIEENTREIIQHLIKLWLYSDAETCNHWKQEVYSFLYQVPRLKGSNKFPSKKFILNNTIVINEDNILALLRIVITDYRNQYEQKNIEYPTMKKHILLYFDWLAEELSINGKVARNDVYAKLSELGFGK